jgi:hypothetical protein
MSEWVVAQPRNCGLPSDERFKNKKSPRSGVTCRPVDWNKEAMRLTAFLDATSVSANTPLDFQAILCAREKLGYEAELEIVKYETARLKNHPPLAKRIKHVAVENVSAGYDILSFTELECVLFRSIAPLLPPKAARAFAKHFQNLNRLTWTYMPPVREVGGWPWFA